MWQYEKKLQFPINIKNPNPKLASYIISQYGGAYSICLSNMFPKHHFKCSAASGNFHNFFDNILQNFPF